MDRQTESSPPAPPEAPAVRTRATYRARSRRREFLITIADEEYLRPSGFGLTFERVLADLVAECTEWLADDNFMIDPTPGHDDPRDFDDRVIWEGSTVLAVLRVDREGTGMEVVRFDGPDPESGPIPEPAQGPTRGRDRGPLRAFDVVIRDSFDRRHEEFGLTLDAVIEREMRSMSGDDGSWGPFDVAIWEGDRCRALLERSGDGTGRVVYRDDGRGGPPAANDPV